MKRDELILAVVLMLLSIEDIKKHKISICPIIIIFLWEIWRLLQQEQVLISNYLWGLVLGLMFCILAVLTKEMIGLGDGLVIALIGLHTGIRNGCICLCIAFFLIAFVAVLLYGCRKIGKKTRLPFVPFLFAGYLVAIWNHSGG